MGIGHLAANTKQMLIVSTSRHDITIWPAFASPKPEQQNNRDRMGGRSVHRSLEYDVKCLCSLAQPVRLICPPGSNVRISHMAPEHQLDKMLPMIEEADSIALTAQSVHGEVRQLLLLYMYFPLFLPY